MVQRISCCLRFWVPKRKFLRKLSSSVCFQLAHSSKAFQAVFKAEAFLHALLTLPCTVVLMPVKVRPHSSIPSSKRNLSRILRILHQGLLCTFLMYLLSLSGGTSPVSFKNSLLSTVLFRSMLDYTGFDGSSETFYFLPPCIYIAFYFLLHIIPESCYYTC